MKCEQCGECCEQTIITLNVFDLAKIIEHEQEWTFQEYSPLNNNWGLIKNKKPIITIQGTYLMGKLIPTTQLKYNPCPYYENKKCGLHEKKIDPNSTLGQNLKRINIPLEVKPTICRNHPYYYDEETRTIMKFKPCNQVIKSESSKKEDITPENKKVYKVKEEILKHYQRTGDYKILDIAKELIKNDYESLSKLITYNLKC